MPRGIYARPPLTVRFWSKVDKSADCWIWTGARNQKGYGVFWNGERTYPAHRFAYEEQHGPIPDGLVPDHLCRNRACTRPSHIEVVTNCVNILRGVGTAAMHARQTHCLRGHRLDGSRRCKACDRIRARARRVVN